MKINYTYPINTEYRIFKTSFNGVERSYLQFKEEVEVRCFPAFWRTKKVERWHFIPNKDQYLRSYISTEECPTDLENFIYDESNIMLYGQEEELQNFKKTHPSLDSYFDTLNMKRALYMDKKERSNV